MGAYCESEVLLVALPLKSLKLHEKDAIIPILQMRKPVINSVINPGLRFKSAFFTHETNVYLWHVVRADDYAGCWVGISSPPWWYPHPIRAGLLFAPEALH